MYWLQEFLQVAYDILQKSIVKRITKIVHVFKMSPVIWQKLY